MKSDTCENQKQDKNKKKGGDAGREVKIAPQKRLWQAINLLKNGKMAEGAPFKTPSERRRGPYRAKRHLEAAGGPQRTTRGLYGTLRGA